MTSIPEQGSPILFDLLTVALPVMMTIVFYSVYWFIAASGELKDRIFAVTDRERAGVIHIMAKRVSGFLLLGAVPLAISFLVIDDFTFADAGLWFNPEKSRFTIISIILLSVMLIPIISYGARRPTTLAIYPEIRASRWTVGLLAADIIAWALYLFGYEVLFRGILLFGLAESLGPVTAVTINVILYSAAHIPKGKEETLGAIPFGIVLCILTLASGTVWIAFVLHLVNAVTLTFTAIRHNPEMSFCLSDE